jgi:glyoxylase-like metal-dependent hydrolase (beta-lactamase superfamily II)
MSDDDTMPTRAVLLPNDGWDTRLHWFRAGDEVDTFALITQRYLVIVDTMSTPELAADVMQALQRVRQGRQLLVINTHAHYDHCWGNALFSDTDGRYAAPIIGHARMRDVLLSQHTQDELAHTQQENPRFAQVRLVPPTITFTDSLQIDGGDLTLDLIPTPGHCDDHIAIWIPQIWLLLAGDAAEHPFPHVTRAEDLPLLRASLEQMLALDPQFVVPCHGGTTDPGLLRRNLNYFDEVAHRCLQARETGIVPEDWDTNDQLADALHFPFAEALQLTGADPARTSEIYQRFHRDALRATLGAQALEA